MDGDRARPAARCDCSTGSTGRRRRLALEHCLYCGPCSQHFPPAPRAARIASDVLCRRKCRRGGRGVGGAGGRGLREGCDGRQLEAYCEVTRAGRRQIGGRRARRGRAEVAGAESGVVVHERELDHGADDERVAHGEVEVERCRVGHAREVLADLELDGGQREHRRDACAARTQYSTVQTSILPSDQCLQCEFAAEEQESEW